MRCAIMPVPRRLIPVIQIISCCDASSSLFPYDGSTGEGSLADGRLSPTPGPTWLIYQLELKPRAKLTKEVSYILLPSHNERVGPGTKCKVAGWGRTSQTRKKTSVLMEVNLKVQSNKVCEKYFKNGYLHQSMVCVGDDDRKKSTWKGDSGGPLVCNGKAHGIVSRGRKCCIFPKVFTRVLYFEPWIRKELRKFALQDLPDSPLTKMLSAPFPQRIKHLLMLRGFQGQLR
ncbi:unnamed protein product [Bubo scandiacus]